MAYTTMKKLIANQNIKYKNGAVDADSYKMWKNSTMNKLDVFLTCDRITQTQYEELLVLLLDV
ncbi:MAG: hypothetical protein IJA10_10395 [Lachnospiraceae bacterium]|nr:hypothetical protein [Lachnospiraceae bacterium]